MPEDDELGLNLLSYQRNITISNYILHEACQVYYTNYKKKMMPISFVEFFFNEFKRYDVLSIAPVIDFFKAYKPKDLAAIIENYQTNFYTLIVDTIKKKDEFYLKLQNNDYMTADLSDPNMFRDYDPELYTNLENIAKHIVESDELLTIKDLYEHFMIRKIVLARPLQKSNSNKGNITAKVTPAIASALGDKTYEKPNAQQAEVGPVMIDETLIGTKSEIPNQRGKVIKMYFPKLMLPSPYPTLNDKSRIDSDHRARKIMSNEREIQLINKLQFNRVKYKTGFIEKRKVANKPEKRKFDFDF